MWALRRSMISVADTTDPHIYPHILNRTLHYEDVSERVLYIDSKSGRI